MPLLQAGPSLKFSTGEFFYARSPVEIKPGAKELFFVFLTLPPLLRFRETFFLITNRIIYKYARPARFASWPVAKNVRPPSFHFGGQAGEFFNGLPCPLRFPAPR